MYIQNKPLAAFSKLFIGAAALILEWFLLSQYGTIALRLFPTWVLFGLAVYYLSSALVLALSDNRLVGKSICPVVNGMLIIAIFTLAGGTTLILTSNNFSMPDSNIWFTWILSFIALALVLLDWLLFVKKGRWQIMMPFYGLALPVTYTATIIFTAEMLPSTTEFLYPLEMLNFHEFGLWPAASLMIAAGVLILIFGYILYVIDFIMSGKLAKHIVLPHLKVVEVDENGKEVVEREIPVVAEAPKPQETAEKPKPPKVDIKPEKIDLSPEDKQTLNDLGDTITEAIREEISKQEITIENEDEVVTEKVETSKVEITKIEVTTPEPENKKDTQKPQQNPKTKPQNNRNKSKNHKPNSPKTVNDMKNKPNGQKPNQSHKKTQKPNRPKITRY